MPAKSKAQLRAMYAAAEGKSTLGIPAKVGKDFVEHTYNAKQLPKRINIHIHAGRQKGAGRGR